MKQHFRNLLEFRRQELPQLIPLFLNYFFLVLTSYILKSASSGLFLNKLGVGKLPYAYMLVAIVGPFCVGVTSIGISPGSLFMKIFSNTMSR